MSTALKLRAVDEDDLAVLSACLQDALVPVHDMCFLADEQRFVLVANRFCWENLKPGPDSASGVGQGEAAAPDSAAPYERVHCGITFEHVNRVQAKGFTAGSKADKGRLLEVLAIMAGDGEVTVHFAGGPAVRLEVEAIDAFVQDMGELWPTLWCPHHPVEDGLDRADGTR